MTTEEATALYRLISKRIREKRKGRRMSQQTLGELVNVDRTSIVHIETGRQRPPLHLIWHIAEALQLSPSDLIPSREEVAAEMDGSSVLNEKMVAKIKKAAGKDPIAHARIARFIDDELLPKRREK